MAFLFLKFYIFDLQVDLGIAVQKACESVSQPLKFLYSLDASIKEKIEAIAKSYGASGVEYSEQVHVRFSAVLLKYLLCLYLSQENISFLLHTSNT